MLLLILRFSAAFYECFTSLCFVSLKNLLGYGMRARRQEVKSCIYNKYGVLMDAVFV